MKKTKIIVCLLLIVIISLISFYPVLKNGFVNLDDNSYVTENRVIRSASPANLRNIFTSFFITHYQPVTILSYLLEYHFFKLNPFYYHLTNLILHLLNGLLVFWLIYILTGKIPVSSLVAVFFSIHPMQAESVAWISERKNLLYAFFYLGALISYLYYLRQDRKLKYYFLGLFLFILALLSKSMAITLPLALLAIDYFTSRKINLTVLLEKIPYFLLSLLFGLIALLGGQLSKVIYEKTHYTLWVKLAGASSDILFYLGKICFPSGLSALYSYSDSSDNPLRSYSILIVVILIAGVIFSKRYSRKILFGSGFFLLTVFPAVRFLPIGGTLVADRYVYLSAIGIFYLLAEGFIWLYQPKIKTPRFIRWLLAIVLSGVIVFLGAYTWKRNQVWKDSLSLWDSVLETHPNIASAYNNRGAFFLGAGEYEKARFDFSRAIELRDRYPDDPVYIYNPTYKYYYLNLGCSLVALGRRAEAVEVFKQFIKGEEEYFSRANLNEFSNNKNKVIAANRLALEAEAYFNLGLISDLSGDKDKAMASYLKAIEISPKNVNAHFYLGVLYTELNKINQARAEFVRVLEINPVYQPAYIKLARIYRSLGRKEELKLLYEKAIANKLEFFDAYCYLGDLLVDAKKDKKAIAFYKKAVEINPGSKELCVSLGNAYLTIGKYKEAIIWLKKALVLDPSLAVAHNNLALAYYYDQEYALAVWHSGQAIRMGYVVNPKFSELLEPYRK